MATATNPALSESEMRALALSRACDFTRFELGTKDAIKDRATAVVDVAGTFLEFLKGGAS